MVETLVVKGLKTFSDEQLINVLQYGPIKFLKATERFERVFFFKRSY